MNLEQFKEALKKETGHRYSESIKRSAQELYKSGISGHTIHLETGLAVSTVYKLINAKLAKEVKKKKQKRSVKAKAKASAPVMVTGEIALSDITFPSGVHVQEMRGNAAGVLQAVDQLSRLS